MPDREIIKIPANRTLADLRRKKRKLRVAAYCRVSTEEEEQQSSFEIQVAYYTNLITNHGGWELTGIFADEGISGVRTNKREQFKEMITLCGKKKIDLILTKSVSRFARNTLDCIHHVRLLKSWGISVIFEKEGIDTSDMNSEMILTCLSAFAQAESESISGNVTKGIRMGYENGRFSFRYTNCLGYRKGADGKPEIHPEEAKTIRMIFENFLNGDSIDDIKQCLENKGILTPTGHTEWNKQTIVRILKNEKYMGDVLLQKTYTTNLFEGKHKKNNGEVTQYYIKNHHPAIVSREMFQSAQEELARRNSKKPAAQKKVKTNRGQFISKYPLSERLVCGSCGCYYRRITWDIHGRKQVVWWCINRAEFGKRYCGDSPSIPEEVLHHAILEAIRSLVQNHQKDIEANLENALLDSFSDNLDELPPEAIKNKLKKLEQEFDQLLIMAGEGNEIADRKLEQIGKEMRELKEKDQELEHSEERRNAVEEKHRKIRELISSENLSLEEYSEALVYRMIERITVLSKEQIQIRFVGGYEMTQSLQ